MGSWLSALLWPLLLIFVLVLLDDDDDDAAALSVGFAATVR